MKKKLILIISMNVLLVALAVLLSYRMMAPRYEAKQVSNLNSLGSLHTEAAAEKIASFMSLLRDELKENGVRLIDPSRGPIFLDPSRWLWLRVQDKEWRAQGNLDALPLPNTDVDTWGLRQNKNSLTLSQRVPITKEGVQDFVLIEGGFKLSAFNDLQSDNRFGLWVFDLNSYKKGGLSSAKVFERGSNAGLLDKEEMASMTSDFLNKLFNSNQSQDLKTSLLWQVYFKKSAANDQLGVLGFWTKDAEPQGLSSMWLTLISSLILVAVLSSFLIFKVLGQSEVAEMQSDQNFLETHNAISPDDSSQSIFVGSSPPTSPRQIIQAPATVIPIAKASVSSPQIAVPPQRDNKKDIQRLIKGLCGDLKGSLSGKAAYAVERVLLFIEEKEPSLENFDLEFVFHDFAQSEVFPKVETFFDQDIWRVHSNQNYLKALFSLYYDFLEKHSVDAEEKPRLSVTHFTQDSMDTTSVDLKRSVFFKEPFNRLTIQVSAKNTFTKKMIGDFFELNAASSKIENVELPFSLDAVDHLHARLKMKSNQEEGHVIYLDIPASESRRPEDIVFARQLRGMVPDVSSEVASLKPSEEATTKFEMPQAEVSKKNEAPSKEESIPKDDASEAVKAIRLSEIERVSSFAEGISDERTRARSRFRIKRPGEKS